LAAVVFAIVAIAFTAWFHWFIILVALACALAVYLGWDRRHHRRILRVTNDVINTHQARLAKIGAAAIYFNGREECVGESWFHALDDLITQEVVPRLSPEEQAVLSDPRSGVRDEINWTITERVVWHSFNKEMRP
jgi:hypothetical protein